MARLPALIDRLAAIDGRPRGTIDHVAREVREAGFIQTTKRGRGASDMTPRDAAALVMGLYGARDAVFAAEAIGGFEGLKRRRDTHRDIDLPPSLTALWRARTALEAVEAVVELGPLLAIPAGADLKGEEAETGLRALVTFHRPNLRLDVDVWASPEAETPSLCVSFTSGKMPEAGAYDVVTRVHAVVFTGLHRALFPQASAE